MQPTRRQVLVAAGVVGAAACAQACTADKPLRPTVPRPEDTLRAQAVAREQELVDAYAASLPGHPALRDLLAAVLGDHAAHLAELTGGASSSPTPTTTPAVARPLSIAQLAALERQAAQAHAAAAGRAGDDCDPDGLVLLLASLAACEASHAALL